MSPGPPPFDQTVQLVRQAQAGDHAALSDLLKRYRGRLLARVRLMMGEQARRLAESQDFLQNVFAVAFQGRSSARVWGADPDSRQRLPYPAAGRSSSGPSQADHLLDQGHFLQQAGIHLAGRGIVGQVYALRRTRIHRADQVLIERLGHKGHKGRQQPGQGN